MASPARKLPLDDEEDSEDSSDESSVENEEEEGGAGAGADGDDEDEEEEDDAAQAIAQAIAQQPRAGPPKMRLVDPWAPSHLERVVNAETDDDAAAASALDSLYKSRELTLRREFNNAKESLFAAASALGFEPTVLILKNHEFRRKAKKAGDNEEARPWCVPMEVQIFGMGTPAELAIRNLAGGTPVLPFGDSRNHHGGPDRNVPLFLRYNQLFDGMRQGSLRNNRPIALHILMTNIDQLRDGKHTATSVPLLYRLLTLYEHPRAHQQERLSNVSTWAVDDIIAALQCLLMSGIFFTPWLLQVLSVRLCLSLCLRLRVCVCVFVLSSHPCHPTVTAKRHYCQGNLRHRD